MEAKLRNCLDIDLNHQALSGQSNRKKGIRPTKGISYEKKISPMEQEKRIFETKTSVNIHYTCIYCRPINARLLGGSYRPTLMFNRLRGSHWYTLV